MGVGLRFKSISIYNLALAVPLILAVSLSVAWFMIPNMVLEDARDAARQSAVQTIRQFKIIRGYYTKNVVAKAKATGALIPSIDHVGKKGAIPLPATLIHDLSSLLARENATLGLYSAYPFPNRKDRVQDDFMKEAWAYLSKNEQEVFTREEMRNGKTILRVAVADVLNAEACVSCHNAHPLTPKNDWKMGDVRGIFEVGTNINPAIHRATDIQRMLLIGVFLACLVSLILFKLSKRAKLYVDEIEVAHRETESAREAALIMSLEDPLTNLPNRRAFAEYIENLDRVGFSVLLVDLDRFKIVNDVYGHEAGDNVICKAAERLKAVVGELGIVARLGGDEFGIVYCDKKGMPELLAKEIIASIEQPIEFGGVRAEISASIGIAFAPDHGKDMQSLLRAADLAMYNVKKNGRAGWHIFNERLIQEMQERARLENDVFEAVRQSQFKPFFQPVVNIQTNKIHGFEVLARWEHPGLGEIQPDCYLSIIEQSGLASRFTAEMLRQACRAAKDWSQDIKLSLNISVSEVCDPATPIRLMSILADEHFSPNRLEIEIAETALLIDFDVAKQVISTLRGAGISVLLDNFGAGYSSLGYLKDLEVDGLKIDRSVVLPMGKSKECEKIVYSIISLAQKLGLQPVVEGIENADILERVRNKGEVFGQGYFYSEALPASKVEEIFREQINDENKVLERFAS